jgi:hypothetical protein
MLTDRRWLLAAAAALILLAALVTSALLRRPDYYTVDTVLAQQEMLIGKPIRVRGWALFIPAQTVLACDESTPCCNEAWGDLLLIPDRDRYAENPQAAIHVGGLDCGGDECAITCTPFNPDSAAAYEFVGTLREGERTLALLSLEEIDFRTSYRLEGEGPLDAMRRVPLEMGTFEIVLREP